MRPPESEPRRPSRGHQHISLPFESEADYQACLKNLTKYRQRLTEIQEQHPEIFPQAMAGGFSFHAIYRSRKQKGLQLRRIKLRQTGEVFTLRPSFVMPYLVARTAEVEKALYPRQWGVPFEALAQVFGRDARFSYRAWLACGRPNLVGRTVKVAEGMPEHLVVDEKITWLDGVEVSCPDHCRWRLRARHQLGAGRRRRGPQVRLRRVRSGGRAGLARLSTALGLHRRLPRRGARSGERSSQAPRWCCGFLHSVLKIAKRSRRALRHSVLDKAWEVYRAETKRALAQRARRFREWAQARLQGPVAEMVEKLCARSADFLPAYDLSGAARTSNGVDRLLKVVDRQLYAWRYCHGRQESARLAVRAIGMQWNFHPYGKRLRHKAPERASPFGDLNGFQYHDNWLDNFLVASSMGGLRR